MDLGIASLEGIGMNENSEELDLAGFIEMENAERELDEALSDENTTAPVVRQLQLLHAIISTDYDKDALQALFLDDPNFVSVFGTDADKWADNIQAKIDELNTEASTEGQKLQDFLRWGFFGIPFGKWMRSTNRIRNRLVKYGPSVQESLMKTKSIYLPDYDTASKMIDGLEDLQKTIIEVAKQGESVSLSEVQSKLKKLGISVGKHPETNTDWKAVGGTILGSMIVTVFTLGFGGLAGAIFGAHLASDRGKNIGDRGWTPDKLKKAAKDFVDILDNNKLILDTMKNVKDITVDDEEKQAELRAIGTILKKSLKAYKSMVALLGRGLSAAVK